MEAVDGNQNGGGQIAIAFYPNMGKDARTDGVSLETAGPLAGANGGNGQAVALAFEPRYYSRDNKTGGAPDEVAVLKADASKAGDSAPHIFTRSCARRITPRECERLQGFPDDYTLIPDPRRQNKPAADQPRYHALGNAMAVPVMRWIGERIDLVESLIAEKGQLAV